MTRTRLKREAAALGGIMLMALPAQARLQAQMTNFGEVIAEREKPSLNTANDKSLSARMTIFGHHFLSHTAELTGQLCLRFGVEIRLVADRAEALPREVTAVITHPPLTRPDHVSGTEERFPTPVNGEIAYAGYTFDNDWELQPGSWTIAFVSGGEVLASQTFTIDTRPGSVCPPERVS